MTAADDKVANLDARIVEADQKIAGAKGQQQVDEAKQERARLQQQRDDAARARVQADRDAARNDAGAARGQAAIDGVTDLVRPDPPPPPEPEAAPEPTDKDVADAEKASEDARRSADRARATTGNGFIDAGNTIMAGEAVRNADDREVEVKTNRALSGCVAPVLIAAVIALGLGYVAYNELVGTSAKCANQNGLRADHLVLTACTDVAAGSASTDSASTSSESRASESTSASSAPVSEPLPPSAQAPAPPIEEPSTAPEPAPPPPETIVAAPPPESSPADVPPPDDGGGPAPGPAVPPSGCAPPDSISVQGGDTGALSGRGGTFTVTGSSVVLSTPALTDCGEHYKLAFVSNGTGAGGATHNSSGRDCQRTGFNYDISGYVQLGDTVSVSLVLPPNECG